MISTSKPPDLQQSLYYFCYSNNQSPFLIISQSMTDLILYYTTENVKSQIVLQICTTDFDRVFSNVRLFHYFFQKNYLFFYEKVYNKLC